VYPPTRGLYFIGQRLIGGCVAPECTRLNGQLVEPYKAKTYKQSQLYTQKFSNRFYSIRGSSGFTFDCNLKTRQCFAPSGVTGGGGSSQSCDNPRHSSLKQIFASCLARADNFVQQAFNADPTVNGIRASMTGMMSLGLVTVATTGGGFPGTDLARGAYFDPWVVNQPCGTHPQLGTPAGREYPINP
jgi:hypothetical protein